MLIKTQLRIKKAHYKTIAPYGYTCIHVAEDPL